MKAIANDNLDELIIELKDRNGNFSKQLLRDISDFRKYPEKFKVIHSPRIPDGSPIGSYQCFINK